MEIIPFETDHLNEWERLETLCFSDRWSRAQMEACLDSDGYIALALVLGGRLAGYGCMYHVLDEGSLANIAVDPVCRRRGLGGMLLDRFIAESERLGLQSLTLEVRASNAAAIGLYASRGFRPCGMRPGYYQNPSEDALLMTKIII